MIINHHTSLVVGGGGGAKPSKIWLSVLDSLQLVGLGFEASDKEEEDASDKMELTEAKESIEALEFRVSATIGAGSIEQLEVESVEFLLLLLLLCCCSLKSFKAFFKADGFMAENGVGTNRDEAEIKQIP